MARIDRNMVCFTFHYNRFIGVTSSGVQHKQAGRIAQRIDHIKTQLLEEGGSYHE